MRRAILLYVRGDGGREAEVARAMRALRAAARRLGLTVLVHPEKGGPVGMVIAVGGDGTFLDASHRALELDVPIAGVNAGSLGFLTEITPDDPGEMERILGGDPLVQPRIALDVLVSRGRRRLFSGRAVNEVLVMRRVEAPMLDLVIRYAGMSLPHYKADGVLVATPTGSTAYNLSLSGPILFPTERSMVLNALAPHALTNRPLVLPSASPIEITLDRGDAATLSVDGGEPAAIETGDRIEVRESDRMLKFVPNSRRSYFDVLARKLNFGRRD